MTKPTDQTPAVPPRLLPAIAVLGLSDPADGDWGRLRGLQYAGLARLGNARLAAHALAAMLVVQALAGSINIMILLGWAALLAVVLIRGARFDVSLEDADRRRISRQEMYKQTIYTALAGLIWIVPIAFLSSYASAEQRLLVWSVMAMLMAGTALAFAAVPLEAVLFNAILGLASIVMFVWYGRLTAAAAAVTFVIFLAVGSLEAARTFLSGKMAEANIAEKSEVVSLLLREFEEGGADWLWQTDSARRVRAASPRFAFALGEDPESIDGKPLLQLIAGPSWESGNFDSSLHDLAERLKRRESFSNVLVRVTLHGNHRSWQLSASPKFDDNANFIGFRGVGSDVTEQRESADKIAYLARYDTLTGLPNRLMLNETLGKAMCEADRWRMRCGLMMIDLDRFKAVNDTLGHLVGDQLLARVSDRLKSLMSENEICGRLGGDEFAIVVRDALDGARIREVAYAVITALSQPYEIDHHMLFVGASVGSAIGPRDGTTVETLMRNADLALYRAKEEGGGQHFEYEPMLHAHAEERRQLEFSLRHALERGEFALAFEPVVDAITEVPVSFEALLRWHSAEHGPVSPAKFIPLAEDTRLIVPIGEWVLRSACCEAMNWPDPIKVAVNVSGEQLLDPSFAEVVVSALATSGLPPHRLEIEVTESIFVREGTAAQQTLERIMSLGCGVALDDFGTGYSSLGYLRKLRFSTVKVDRSFVQGAARDNPESLAIVRAVVAMADALEMSTTAEGVETEEELAKMRLLGCKKIQGYFFGRPMSAGDALALFDRLGWRNGSAVA